MWAEQRHPPQQQEGHDAHVVLARGPQHGQPLGHGLLEARQTGKVGGQNLHVPQHRAPHGRVPQAAQQLEEGGQVLLDRSTDTPPVRM